MDAKLNLASSLSECECVFQSVTLTVYRTNQALLNNDDFAKILARWRNENSEYFVTQVPTNPEKTKAWLKYNFGNKTTNMFFIVVDRPKNNMVGHFGISARDIHSTSFDVHSVLRGEKSSGKNLMHDALDQALNYCQQTFGARQFCVNCFETSISALSLYKRLKFEEKNSIYLIKSPFRGGYKWIKSDVKKDGAIRMFQLELQKDMQ